MAKVVKGASTFSRRVIDLLRNLPDGNLRIKLLTDFHLDLDWWRRPWASTFNGEAYIIRRNTGVGPTMYTDSSLKGYGVIMGQDWIGVFFNIDRIPRFKCVTCADYHWLNVIVPEDENIKFLELVPIYLVLILLAPDVAGSQLICYTDNTQVMAMINKGVSVNHQAMRLIREMFWISVNHNIHITAR